MYCPKCGNPIPERETVCPNCRNDVSRFIEDAPSAPRAASSEPQSAPRKRNTFLGVFSFVLSLLSAWTTFVVVLVGKMGFFERSAGNFGRMFFLAATFFCLVTALLALLSLFGKNIKRGLGIFALIASLVCLAVLYIPVGGLLPDAKKNESKPVAVVSIDATETGFVERAGGERPQTLAFERRAPHD